MASSTMIRMATSTAAYTPPPPAEGRAGGGYWGLGCGLRRGGTGVVTGEPFI